jgi:transposase-like protein
VQDSQEDSPAGHPVVGVNYPGTYQQLLRWFPDDAACLEYLARLRWPDGFVCPVCASSWAWWTATSRWMCRECGRQTSVTAGTIFHRTRTPLSTWFAAVWFMTSQKNGLSALGLQRVLGFGSYETAWAWMHKLRRAMVRPDREMLSGAVELDEVFLGQETRGKAGGVKDKISITVAVEVLPNRALGRVRLAVTPQATTRSLLDFAEQTITGGTVIRTDGATVLPQLSAMGYQHEYFTGLGSQVPAHETMPGVHLVASLLKRWLTGTLHYAVSQQHLAYYLDEYTFRFNRRTARRRGLLFYRLLQQAVGTDPHPLKDLVTKPITDWT